MVSPRPSWPSLSPSPTTQPSHPPQEQVEGPFQVSAPPQLPASFQGFLIATDLVLLGPKTAHSLQPSNGLPHHLPCLRHCILDLQKHRLEKGAGGMKD